MKRVWVIGGLTAVATVVMSSALLGMRGTTASGEIKRGRQVYTANCATCHGDRAQGHADFGKTADGPFGLHPPPPHDATGHTWHHSDGTLYEIIRDGGQSAYGIPGFQSNMPAFGGRTSDEEIRSVLTYFKSLWGEKERSFQAEVTRNDQPSLP